MIKYPNGVYADKGKYHRYFYKLEFNCVYRYSKTLDEWILCLDDKVISQIKGVLYEHPIDKDCYVFRSEEGLVMKCPKSILDNPKLEEILLEYSSSS